jgi:hypothetical protein
MYAKITGGSGDRGKCTIEVTVDGTAEIEILAEQGRMKTVNGQRAVWKRMDCNRPLPLNPEDFKLSPQEGRGKQSLLKSPKENRGVAAVRIEDPSGGSAGYKFDLEWRGGTAVATPVAPVAVTPAPAVSNATPNSNVTGGTVTLDQRQAGTGYFRDFRAAEQPIVDAAVKIEGDRVQLELISANGPRVSFTGTIILRDRDRLVANVSGGTIQGSMEILLSNGRVEELAMTGVGANRFEARWQRK